MQVAQKFTDIGNAPVGSGEERSYVYIRKEEGEPRRNSRQTENLFIVMKGYSVSRESQIIQSGSSMVLIERGRMKRVR